MKGTIESILVVVSYDEKCRASPFFLCVGGRRTADSGIEATFFNESVFPLFGAIGTYCNRVFALLNFPHKKAPNFPLFFFLGRDGKISARFGESEVGNSPTFSLALFGPFLPYQSGSSSFSAQ